MRNNLLLLPFAVLAARAAAAPAPDADQIQIPPQLTDPATADRLGNMIQGLSRAFLDLPVGEVEAAAEGRPPTPQDKNLTIRDLGRRDDPDFDRNVERQIAEARPIVRESMEAFARALPAMTRAMSEMAKELERATANMPRPDYPRR